MKRLLVKQVVLRVSAFSLFGACFACAACSMSSAEPVQPQASPALSETQTMGSSSSPSAKAPVIIAARPADSPAETTASLDAEVAPRPSAAATSVSGETPARGDLGLQLPRFHHALRQLQLGRRDEHVRVVVFGDSHIAADFFTGRLRQLLQARFGHGGPGYVPLAIPGMRHDQVKAQHSGKWRREPSSPASFQTQGDGQFGLAGTRATALGAAEAQLELYAAAQNSAPYAALRWELVFRLPTPASPFTLQVGKEAPRRVVPGANLVSTEPGARTRASGLQEIRVEAAKDAQIRIRSSGPGPMVFGMIGETATPGVVLDALGINGARARTILGWKKETWQGELQEREPALVVLAYGTNEVGDRTQVGSYASFYAQVLARVREAVPNAECLLIGPTERVDASFQPLPRVQQIDQVQRSAAAELGCAYHSWLSLITESGGLRAWTQASPQLASSDRIHLTRAGYSRLADELYAQIVLEHERVYGAEPVGAAVGPSSTRP